MSSKVIFVEELLLVVLLIFFTEVVDTLHLAVTPHVLEEISVGIGLFVIVGNESPGQNWILSNIIVIPPRDFIQPLQILVIGHELVNPKNRLLRTHIVRKGVLFNFDILLSNGKEGIDIPEIEMEEHFLTIFGLNVNGIVVSIEPLLIDLPNITKGNIKVIEDFVLECFYAHMIEIWVPMRRAKYYTSLFCYPNLSLNYSKDINE